MRQFQGYIVNSGRNNVSQISQDSIDINLKYIYRDIKMEWIKNTAFSYVFENHYLHTNLNEFDFLLKIFCEGSQVLKKDLGQIDLLPGENKLFNFSLDIDLRPGQVYEFRTTAKLKEDKVWAKRGHIVSEERTLIKKETNGKLIKILD